MNRRTAVTAGAAALTGGALAGVRWCGPGRSSRAPAPVPRRPSREIRLVARPSEVELGPGLRPAAWTYDGLLPGPELRLQEGERVRIALDNKLPAPTSIHWHGLPQRGTNSMDGVPGVTQNAIAPGDSFVYEFTAEPAGTF